ncbi:MAG TPA: hypothetical protein VK009_01685 [Chloroflexota bacterium]|nr:hypothetical protein [Chloroflexota bacterium]
MNSGPQAQRPKQRNRLLIWLLGDPKPAGPAAAAPAPSPQAEELPPAPAPLLEDEDPGRAALLGLAAGQAPPQEPAPAPLDQRPSIPRDLMVRVNVSLPANLEIEDQKTIPVRLTSIAGSGVSMLIDSPERPPAHGNWLDLALPNRPKPLEVEVDVVRTRAHLGPQAQEQVIAHGVFPSIRRNEQDAIIAYINNIRLYESKQYTVAAKVMLEVVTGRRRFAKFTGETIEIRPDQMRLLMDDFDAIAGAEVMLTIMAPKFADHLDVENVRVERVEIISPRKAEVEVSLDKPDDKVLLFIRKHYPGVAKGGGRR